MLVYILWICITSFFLSVQCHGAGCHEFELPCENGNCVDDTEWCDGEINCNDGSDEAYCMHSTSTNKDPNNCDPIKYFKCRDGPCIPISGRCDEYETCEDKSDEANCDKTGDETSTGASSKAHSVSENTAPGSPPNIHEHPETVQSNYIGETKFRVTPGKSEPTTDFIAMKRRDFYNPRERARNWLISQRKADYGWDDDTHRAMVAMCLSSIDSRDKDENHVLMVKQLEVELSTELARNESKEMSLTDLSLYINALQATCKNPRNFYGIDMVDTLRQRVHEMQRKGNFISPLVYLTLCVNNDVHYDDLRKLNELFLSRNPVLNKMDIQSIAVLAATCITNMPVYNNSRTSVLENGLTRILGKIAHEGQPGNVYEAALLFQALDEAKVDESKWNRAEAFEFIENCQQDDGSFGNTLATYYALPILSGRSLISLKGHCDRPNTSDLPLEVIKNTKRNRMVVKYSLQYGLPFEITQTMQISVAVNTSFFDIMRLAESINSNYRFELDNGRNVPTVYSIGGKPNDADRGMYWILHSFHKRPDIPSTQLVPFGGSIKNLFPRNGDELIFWRKPMS